LEHIRDINMIIERSIEILQLSPLSNRFNLTFKEKIKRFENPNIICFNYIREKL
jgi:hypothetical protein